MRGAGGGGKREFNPKFIILASGVVQVCSFLTSFNLFQPPLGLSKETRRKYTFTQSGSPESRVTLWPPL